MSDSIFIVASLRTTFGAFLTTLREKHLEHVIFYWTLIVSCTTGILRAVLSENVSFSVMRPRGAAAGGGGEGEAGKSLYKSTDPHTMHSLQSQVLCIVSLLGSGSLITSAVWY